jgi:hypothetical protein
MMDQNVEYNDELQAMATPVCLSAKVHKCSSGLMMGNRKKKPTFDKTEKYKIKSKGGR